MYIAYNGPYFLTLQLLTDNVQKSDFCREGRQRHDLEPLTNLRTHIQLFTIPFIHRITINYYLSIVIRLLTLVCSIYAFKKNCIIVNYIGQLLDH
jgi:hypothetical protein